MRSRQSGMANLKAIFVLAIIGASIYLAFKLLPPYMNNYQFQAEVDETARYSTYAVGKTAEDIRNDLIQKARQHDILLTPQEVKVVRGNSSVDIDIKYTVRVELPGKVVNLDFNPTAGNKMLGVK